MLVSVGLRWNSLLTLPFPTGSLDSIESRVTCRKPVLQGLTATAGSLRSWTLPSLFGQTALGRLLVILKMIPLFKSTCHHTSHIWQWEVWSSSVKSSPSPLPHISKQLLDKSKELQTYQAPNCIITVLLIHPSLSPFSPNPLLIMLIPPFAEWKQ